MAGEGVWPPIRVTLNLNRQFLGLDADGTADLQGFNLTILNQFVSHPLTYTKAAGNLTDGEWLIGPTHFSPVSFPNTSPPQRKRSSA
jgi:hypothetical protein